MSKELDLLMIATSLVWGVDPTKRTRERYHVYARSSFWKAGRDLVRPMPEYRVLGEFTGGRDHATAIHGCKKYDNEYCLVKEFTKKDTEVRREFLKLKDRYKMFHTVTVEAVMNNLPNYEEISFLKSENENLRHQIELLTLEKETLKTYKNHEIDSRLSEINNLPELQKEEFLKYKWQPHKKMLESRVHYPIFQRGQRVDS